jgi:hypothetical protein
MIAINKRVVSRECSVRLCRNKDGTDCDNYHKRVYKRFSVIKSGDKPYVMGQTAGTCGCSSYPDKKCSREGKREQFMLPWVFDTTQPKSVECFPIGTT